MDAILLCAGFGTRLYPLTRHRAKPLLPVAGKPIVGHLVDQLRPVVDRFVVVSNGRFADAFRAWAPPDVEVVDNGVLTNAERMGAVRDLVLGLSVTGDAAPVVVAGGDNLYRADLSGLRDAYQTHATSVIAAFRETDQEKLRRTGVAEVDEAGQLTCLWEKPPRPPTELGCPPLYLLDPSALSLVPRFLDTDQSGDSPGQLIAWLCQQVSIWVCILQGTRHDVGCQAGYEAAQSWMTGRGTD